MVSLYCKIHTNEAGDNVTAQEYFIIKKYDGNVSSHCAVRETQALQLMDDHHNIIELVESVHSPRAQHQPSESFYLVTEKCAIGDISEYLEDVYESKAGDFSEIIAKDHFRQLMNAVAHLHRNGIAHQDISAQNIVVHTNKVLKLIDFEMSIYLPMMSNNQRQTTLPYAMGMCGKHPYFPPELYDVIMMNETNTEREEFI